ncbi:uncharacterized protein LOC123524542 [Mercenaria mercenaria]|uniref:uncharacterized protein LOC123524542 n=1 Tax=Mercenaria mercenaria TaxID=6596 RepID=UPI00234EA089|nr:uncharacterized protein LOC123524542 [Mercenaria mercenaria]XP_045158750.2 uncharacterized protein LOC123524542 [Mercenaria mercenaria]
MITVIFTVTSASDICDWAAIVGNIPELGSWDPTKGVIAIRHTNTKYAATVNIPEGLNKIEFKWIFWHGGHMSWEAGRNKVIYDLPKKAGSVCHISNVLNGPARKLSEIDPPSRYNFQGISRCYTDMTRNNCERISRFLNPQNWSRRSQILGLGLCLLVPLCAAMKIMH